MVDENSSNSPTGNATDVPPKGIETAAPVTKDDGDGSAPVVNNNPSPTTDAKKFNASSHDAPRPHFKWHAEVLVEGHDVYQGIAKDISMEGFNLILDHNLQNSKLVKLHIHIPPPDISSPHHILEVSGKITSSVYDNDEESFRSYISITEFTLESDHTYLQSLLS